MKAKITLRNILVLAAFVFGLIAFILAFSAGLKVRVTEMGITVTTQVKGLIFGKQKIIVGGVETAIEDAAHARASIFGAILLLVAPLLAVVATLLLPKGKVRFILLGCEVLVIVAIIMVICLKGSYARSGVAKAIKEAKDAGVDVASDDKKEMIREAKKSLKEYKLNDSAVFMVIMGFLSAACLTVAQFVKGKK